MAFARGRFAMASLALVVPLLAGCADDGSADDDTGTADTAPTTLAPFTLEFQDSGSVVGSGPGTSPATPHGCTTLEEEGLDVIHHPWEIPDEVNGTAVAVSEITVALHIADASLLDADLYLEDEGGAVLGSATAFNAQAGPDESVTVTGGLSPGTYQVIVRGCAGRGAYEVSGTATLHPVVAVAPVAAPTPVGT